MFLSRRISLRMFQVLQALIKIMIYYFVLSPYDKVFYSATNLI
jgi:hypothetical protein